MQNTTESPVLLDGELPPPPPARAPTPPNQISQAPSLPSVVAAVPTPAPATANPFATSMNPPAPAGSPRPPQRGGGARRFLSWMLLLAMIGGAVYAAIVYGPGLMDRVTGDEELDEVSAPLVFPTAAVVAAPIRTASYLVEQRDALGEVEQHSVTTDFETGVSQVIIDRGDRPDLEVLSLWDQSFVRRADEQVWYQMPRGDFPVDTSLGRSRWVRTLDEALPPAMRPAVTIERSTESVIANEPASHLLVSIDPRSLTRSDDSLTGRLPVAPVSVDADTADPAAGVDPAAAPSAASPEPPTTPVMPPGMRLLPGAMPTEPIDIELWIDNAGIVRKITVPAELGGETITVSSVSADPFEPVFPVAESIQPLTADALFRLGL